MKTFYFQTGLPRSGSTLFSNILNQNPEIYSAHQTDLLTIMAMIKDNLSYLESYNAEIQTTSYWNVIQGMGESFYRDIDKPIIIDKCRGWGLPYSQPYAHCLNKDYKMIYLYRPILEVLASFIVLAEKNPETNFIDKSMILDDFRVSRYTNINDARCDWLMNSRGQIDNSLGALGNMIKEKNKERLLLISYDELITNPKNTFDKLYKFLNLSSFDHNFANITTHEEHNDMQAFGIPDLHHVPSTIIKSKTDPFDVLSDYVINKYSGTLDFLTEHLRDYPNEYNGVQ